MASITRRLFSQSLLGAAAFAASSSVRAAQPQSLVARASQAQLAPPEYPVTDIWGYEGIVPGPLIRLQQGARVSRRFENELPQASSVHWHGIRIENAMDGVAGLTQAPVEPGASFLYEFDVPDAGTYWFHPHNRSWEQMALGLYGALIVEETDGAPEVDRDEVLLIDDWRLTDGAQIAPGFGDMHDWAHAGRLGNWVTVNGTGSWTKEVRHLERIRLRLVNAANARIFTLGLSGLEGWVVALDGMPLEIPEPLDRLALAPAQRADLILDVKADEGADALLLSREREGAFAIAAFPVRGSARLHPLSQPEPLPPNSVPSLGSLADARATELVMQGGAMGAMRGAMIGGRMMGMREMAAAGKVWAFNGAADMPDAPLVEADQGETLRIVMVNDTAWPHAMHLHGHHFRQINADGTAGPLRDTLLMDRGETSEIAFVADNPGDWLLHCHMLEHSAGGMMTWLRVA